jgi:hypothetical protein
MINIKFIIKEEIIKEAKKYQSYRNNLKKILDANNLNYDKFTITTRDVFDGYITEKMIIQYLEYLKGSNKINIWEDIYKTHVFQS